MIHSQHNTHMLRPRLCSIALALFAPLFTAVGKEKSITPEELSKRRWLNEHVILIWKDGKAIEPYDYLHSQGIFKKDKITPLQVPYPDPDDDSKPWKHKQKEWSTAFEHSGCIGMPSIPKPRAGRGNAFVFRDYVVPRMLNAAATSGKKPLVFIHGGLNTLKGAVERAYKLTDSMEEDGYYPIFICWDSSLLSSYGQHIFAVRNGRDGTQDRFYTKALTAPVYLATDLVVSIARLPRTLLDLGRSSTKPNLQYKYPEVIDSLARYFSLRAAMGEAARGSLSDKMENEKKNLEEKTGLTVDKISQSLVEGWSEIRVDPKSKHWRPMKVSQGKNDVNLGMDTFWRQVGGWGLMPFKLVVMGAFAGGGTEAWGVMLGRVEMMFHHQQSYQPGLVRKQNASRYAESNPDVRYADSTGVGALAVFWREVENLQKEYKLGKVTLMGHSMGAIVSNRTLSEFPGVRCERIVYMAAAASIMDTYTSLVPYLDRHKETHFYNLCLHPRAEEREGSFKQNWWGDFLPRGSLLVWIDDFLNNPHTIPERTMGSFENALLGSSLFPPRVQGQMHMTALSVGAKSEETVQMHGDFTKHRFWERKFVEDSGDNPRSGYKLPDE